MKKTKYPSMLFHNLIIVGMSAWIGVMVARGFDEMPDGYSWVPYLFGSVLLLMAMFSNKFRLQQMYHEGALNAYGEMKKFRERLERAHEKKHLNLVKEEDE